MHRGGALSGADQRLNEIEVDHRAISLPTWSDLMGLSLEETPALLTFPRQEDGAQQRGLGRPKCGLAWPVCGLGTYAGSKDRKAGCLSEISLTQASTARGS